MLPARLTRTVLAALLALLLVPALAQADTVFAPTDAPGGDALSDSPIEVGMKIRSSQDGFITALRFYKQTSNTGSHVGHLWGAGGQLLATASFDNETATGWQQVELSQPVAITANTTYVVSYYSAAGKFAWSPGFFTSTIGAGALTAPADGIFGGNGVYRYGAASGFPTDSWNGTNYWVDAVFSTAPPSDTRPPQVSGFTPADGSGDVPTSTAPTVTFDEPMTASTVNATNVSLKNELGTAIPASVSYDAPSRTATLTPTAALPLGHTYTVTVKGGATGVADTAGNRLAADKTWSFNTSAACPCSVFNATEGPLDDAVNDQPIEVGMKLRSSEDGFITALRFYKQPSNTGTHVGHLWAADGTQLAEVTFTNETASGWQTELLPQPVQITKNTTYVTSYYAASGRYAWSPGYFGSAVNRTPLSAPSDAAAGGNGVYKYGASGYPSATFGATNYWVDASFERTRPADTRPPRVSSATPAANAKRVPVDSKVEITFDEPLDRPTVNTGSILLSDAAGPVPGTVTYDETTRKATLTPSAPLSFGKTYQVTLKSGNAGVTDIAGNRLPADQTWSFSTPPQCPCRIFDPTNEGPSSASAAHDQPIEVGVRFKSAEDGFVTALRFYKQANNVGTHVAHLWAPDGQLLASVTFTSETASGWQNVDLPNPVAITKDTVYTASYYSPSGFFPFDQGYFGSAKDSGMLTAFADSDGHNGVYKYGASGFPTSSFGATNYWVDLTFDRTVPPDTRGPVVTDVTPTGGASDVARSANIVADFDEQLAPTTINGSTFTLKGDTGVAVPATVSYNAQTREATLDPSVPLAYQTTYTATLKGGTGGVTDAAGNALTADKTWSFTVTGQPPTEGPGGPILVLTDPSDPFGTYYAEILRSEGLNSFAVSDGPVTSDKLTGHTTVILAKQSLTAADVTLLTNWVQSGGNLIAMRPDKKLAPLLGLTDAGTTLTNGYLKVNSGSAAGAGIESMTLQYHDVADRYTLNGASSIATMYSDATTATTSPAVSLRDVGTGGGQAAAFSFDLARSVVWTRQGNPAWAGQKRDGLEPLSIRPDDLFFGAKAGDVQPDWVDHNRLEVPQADEQQRLLANLITQMNLDKAPLPRFWYLPRGDKAAVVLTGDDHAQAAGRTPAYFDRLIKSSPAGCSVADWQCVRATSYMYPNADMTVAQAKAYQDQGFEIALHLNTGCLDWTPDQLEGMYQAQLGSFAATWPDVNPPTTNRTHCITWSDWASQAKIERAHGIRFDTNYYYKGPASWADRPALLTGSGFPQRFGDLDGSMIDVYQSTTQITDEMNETLPTTTQIHTLLDNALGAKNYWGVIDVILHTDAGDHRRLNELVADAQSRGVPIVTSAQMLSWLDGRNGSSFSNISYSGNTLTFGLTAHPTARGLRAMLPARSASGPLSKLMRDGQSVSWSRKTIKGVDYVMFNGASGNYTATYATDTIAPDISAVSATADAEGHATVSWTTDEPSGSLVQYGRTASLGYEQEATAEVTDHKVELTGLQPSTTYTFKVSSTDSAGNTATSSANTFATVAGALVDSRTSEFASGTLSNAFAGDTLTGPDGEVQLQPTVGDEFNGPSITPALTTKAWTAGGSTWLSNGSFFADTSVIYSQPPGYVGPRVLEFAGRFQPVPEQSIGLGGDLGDFPYAIFTTGVDGDLPGIRVSSGANPDDTQTTELPSVDLYAPHRFRIEWNATNVKYYVDGALVATHNVAIDQEMGPAASDSGLFGGAVQVYWMRMSGFPASGTLTSRTLDSGPGANDWGTLTPTAPAIAGTSITYQTRSGSTRQPDATWSAWSNLGTGNAILSPNSRYLQYRATLSTTNANATPTLQRVQVSYGAGTDHAPTTGTVTLAPTAPKTNQALTASVSGFTDSDGDPITMHYDWFRNGVQIPGASSSTLNLALAGNGDRGDKIRVEAYASDNKGAASDAASAKVVVANTAPTAGSVSVRPVPAATKDLMRATPAGFADIDGDPLTYRYQWLINNVPVAGATNATFDVSGKVAIGDRVDVDVYAVDDALANSPTVRGGQNITSTNSTPVEGTVAITPAAPKTNDLVTAATNGFHDPDGDALTFHYTWTRNGTTIAGATGATLNLSQAGNGDRGDTIKVTVTATDPANHTSEAVTDTTTVATTAPTAGTVSVRPVAPAATDTVSAVNTGFADIDGDALSYQYQWAVDGSDVPLANGRSLDLRDVAGVNAGDVVTVSVRALDGHGGTSPAAIGTTTIVAGNAHPVASYGFEEAGGNVVSDQYGGNDGTLTGADRVNNGRFGRALSFESDDDIVSVPDDSSLHLLQGMTIEAWVKPTATTFWRSIIFKEADEGLSYGLYGNNEDDVPHVHIGSGGETGVSGPTALAPGQWTHLAATYDGNILKLFVNGTQVGSKAVPGVLPNGAGPLTIGANSVWGEHFRGLIDEVRVYNRPLSQSEIATDRNAPVVPGTPAPPSDTDPNQIGSFSQPVQYPITPVHLALLRDGRVAMWDGFEAALNSEHTWDPWSGAFDAIPTGRNLFCAGHVTLNDGRLLVAGGHIQAYEGTKDTNLFNPDTDTWTRGQDMQNARWYPTATTLPDGRVFTVSGDNITLGPNPDPNTPVPLINYSDTLPEIYNPSTNQWTSMPSASRKMPLYPFMFVLPNGKLFDAGPDKVTRTLDLTTGQWTTVGTSPIDGHSAVMYRPGKILKSGTWSDPEFPDRDATDRSAMIDMTAANPTWSEAAPMKYRRSFHTLTVLPDGNVLATGGQTKTDGVDETTGVLPAEMWNPDTNTWTTMASSHRPRLYHSSAVLLPDGRVLLAGGGAYGQAKNEKSGELYSPPYLFKGTRPTVTDAPGAVHYGQSFSVDTPDAANISKVALVHMGTVTHNFDMDQRFMNLSFTAGSGTLNVSGPQNANVAPPGWYMVFLLNNNGVPSYGQIVQVDAAGDTTAPTAPVSLSATAQPDSASLSWAAATDNVGVTGYRIYRSTTNGFTPGPSNRIASVKTVTSYNDTSLAGGTYYYRVKAVDKAGNLSTASPQATAVVSGDTTLPTVALTAPAAGASVSGTVSVTANASDNVGVQSVQFKLDGQNVGAADTTSPYALSWDSTTATDGPHSLTAVARDNSGNTKTSTAVAIEVHNTGLVAAYGFDEASGTTALDALTHRNGTISGGATRVTDGRFGGALSFDGVDDIVSVPHDAGLNLNAGMTLEAWVRPSALGDLRSVVMKDRPGSYDYAMFADSAANAPTANVFTTSALEAVGPAPLTLSTWTHLAQTWDGSTLKLYVDGAEVDSKPAGGALLTSTGQLRIGGSGAGAQFFSGVIDEVRIFDRARTGTQVAADMNTPVDP
jgi:uncharacterized protein DUF4082/concanavalin A-like lectin/glucanase superfamily protein/galactose oxidase-like protein/Big-like domain-containing protein/purple acid phosphatase-like protein